ncbi:hypothetical protein [Polaribacter sp. SA4-12]|uniref:hypothetical protein n=1 Tax=Polaribacter sp. SA4-12 TaxID=1312072 RepID=UPI0012FBE0D3|nr:hypothetical protein [Polaribacter sp. SA4-12]
MITFLKAMTSSIPPPPGAGGPGAPGLPTLPIDNGIIFLFFAAIVFGTYIHYRKIKEKDKINAKGSLN